MKSGVETSRFLKVLLVLFVEASLGSACQGVIIQPRSATGGGSGNVNISNGGNGNGNGGGGVTVTSTSDLPLPRLSHDEYLQTLRDLTKELLPNEADQVLTGDLPTDTLVSNPAEKHGGFDRLDQSEQQQYSDVPIAVGAALGNALTSTPARIATLLGACSNGGTTMDAACVAAFISRFGEIALRHPLSPDDVAFYAATALAKPPTKADLSNIIAVMVSSPRFLYRVESGDQRLGSNVYQLDAWELATRLSYSFWGTMPDAALRDAAKTGRLLTDDGYSSEVNRLAADPRAQPVRRAFFKQWFWPLLELPPLDSRVGDAAYRAFAGANLPGPTLRDHMVDEVLDAATWVMAHGGTLSDLFTNRLSFARDADLAAIYGVPVWDGKSEPPPLPAARVGLLTRAAFLSTGTINTRPIMKGVFIRTTLLCDTLPPPPPNAANVPIMPSTNETTREVVESITEAPGTVCSACHLSQINPLGFASENFDGLGRARTQQTFFDTAGTMTGSKVVDTTSTPAVTSGDTTMSTGMADLTPLILKSGKVEGCMAKRLFRFAFRRIEDASDAGVIAGLAQLATQGKLIDVFTGVAMRPEFKQRVIAP
jgi:Protein of unknown function (DUF1592)/Protein of unknown function (DUF1588)